LKNHDYSEHGKINIFVKMIPSCNEFFGIFVFGHAHVVTNLNSEMRIKKVQPIADRVAQNLQIL